MSSAVGGSISRRVTRNQTSASRNQQSPDKKSSFDSPTNKTDRAKRADQVKRGKKQGSPVSSKDNSPTPQLGLLEREPGNKDSKVETNVSAVADSQSQGASQVN